MVVREQPEPQYQKNKRTDHRLQEEAGHTHNTTHKQREGGESVQLQILGHTQKKKKKLSWATNTTAIVKKAQQWLYFLRTLRKANLSQNLRSFYRCAHLRHPVVVW